MRRLWGKLGKRPSPDSSENAPVDIEAHSAGPSQPDSVSRSERFGLFLLAGNSADASDANGQQYPINIIAVHGLNGDANTTWTHPNGTLWLRDLLPAALPGYRVYTYGYPSQVVFSRSYAAVGEYARHLLKAIRGAWDGWDEDSRSIIFVCHSLGGIVCKQALVYAHEDDAAYGAILGSIAGIAFLGTPQRGSETANIGAVAGRVVNTCILAASAGFQGRAVRLDLLGHLAFDSKALQDLSISVRNRLANLQVVSFYETQPLPPFSDLVVERRSAILGIPGEDPVPLYEDHRSMCRFAGETDSYMAVSRALRRMADAVLSRSQTLARPGTRAPEQDLDDCERSCMALLSSFDVADYRTSLPRPANLTCRWILRHPDFVSWQERASPALLWIKGHPGCGKTTPSLFLVEQLERDAQSSLAPAPASVFIYFCDDKIAKHRDAHGVLLGLIFQLVCCRRSLIRHVRKVFELQGANMARSLSALWNVFLSTISDPACGAAAIIIDALDECEVTSRRRLVESINALLQTGAAQRVKFILTSRPSLDGLETHLQHMAEHTISIDDDEGGGLVDLHSFIQQRVDEISSKRHFPPDMKTFLKDNLSAKAGHTFLWAHMVLSSLERSPLVSREALQSAVASIPPDLGATYQGFLARSPPEHQPVALKLLHLIVAGLRPLSLEELNVAFSVDSTHQTLGDLKSAMQTDMQHTAQAVLGPLVRTFDSKVSLLHQSVKDFLLQKRPNAGTTPAISLIDASSAQLSMAAACIRYLLLEDFSHDLFRPDLDSNVGKASSRASSEKYACSPAATFKETLGGEDEDPFGIAALFKEPEASLRDAGRLIATRRAFYQYAALHWADHYASCEAVAPEDLKDAARRLLDTGAKHGANWWRFFTAHSEAERRDTPKQPNRLTLAAFFGFREMLRSELQGPAASSSADKNAALFWASHQGHTDMLETLLRTGADPSTPGLEKHTALTVAAQNGRADCVAVLLLDPRTDVNARGKRGRTALSLACTNQDLATVNHLLRAPACDPNLRDATSIGMTPLHWAALTTTDTMGTSFTHAASAASVLTALLTHPKTNPNHADNRGRTPLSHAAGQGADTAVRTLLKHSADANLPDARGRTPLSWAAGSGRPSTVRLLLSHHHHHHHHRRRQQQNSSSSRVAACMCDNDKDADGRNAYSWAAGQGHAATLRELVRCGWPGADEPDVDGWAPLTWAVEEALGEAVGVLLELNTTSAGNDTANTISGGENRSSGSSNTDVVDKETGTRTGSRTGVGVVDLERRDRSGGTALAWAVRCGHVRVVRALLRAGADPLARDREGVTPVRWAEMLGFEEIMAEIAMSMDGGSEKDS